MQVLFMISLSFCLLAAYVAHNYFIVFVFSEAFQNIFSNNS